MSKQSTDIAQEPLPTENAPPKRTTLRGLSSKLLVRPPTYLVASIIISVGGTLFGYGLSNQLTFAIVHF